MEPRYPEFFAAHPEFVSREGDDDSELSDTLDSFTRQRLDYSPPGPAMVAQWRANLRRYLGGVLRNDTLAGKRVLDVGCGFGRHMYVASEQGAQVVGIDLSGGVDRAYAITRRRPNCHVVQGNIFERPVRDEAFDIVWSFGVLHHMPDPAAGFHAIVPFARRDGGLVAIWVYGYRVWRGPIDCRTCARFIGESDIFPATSARVPRRSWPASVNPTIANAR